MCIDMNMEITSILRCQPQSQKSLSSVVGIGISFLLGIQFLAFLNTNSTATTLRLEGGGTRGVRLHEHEHKLQAEKGDIHDHDQYFILPQEAAAVDGEAKKLLAHDDHSSSSRNIDLLQTVATAQVTPSSSAERRISQTDIVQPHSHSIGYKKVLVTGRAGVVGSSVLESDLCIKKANKQRNQEHKVVLDWIEILPNDSDALNTRVLCFIPIISTDHNARALDVLHTWGKRCDKLVFASNDTDSDIGAVKVEIPTEDWSHLWQKQRETMRHIWQVYGKEYDFFLKADLDTYVIVENLKAYLASEEIQSKKDQPLILGRRVSRREEKWYQGFDHNKTLADEFLKTSQNKFHYTMGGAGYVMNQKYLSMFYESMDEHFCLSSEQEMTFPEDVGINFCMGNIGVYPYNTRDEFGRERFHLRSPEALFNVNEADKSAWLYKVHRDVGGIKGGVDCCSPASITFHHVKGQGALYDFERMIYCK
jgi:glycoprotein-N-acetylgalactosamine 3-beta-galactosyltransferase